MKDDDAQLSLALRTATGHCLECGKAIYKGMRDSLNGKTYSFCGQPCKDAFDRLRRRRKAILENRALWNQ